MKPQASVIIPTYCRPEKIGCAIESVIKQTFKDFEIIVIDNNTSKEFKEETEKVVKSYGDDRIKYFINNGNQSVSKARNKWIYYAKSNRIAWLDDDDYWISEYKLEEQIKLLNNGYGMVGTSIKMINLITEQSIDYYYPEKHDDLINQLIVECPIRSSSIIYQKEIAKSIWWFRSWPLGEDYDFLLRFLKKAKVISITDPLTAYCIHSNSLSHSVALKSQLYNIIIAATSWKWYPNYSQWLKDRIVALNLTDRNWGKLKSIVLW